MDKRNHITKRTVSKLAFFCALRTTFDLLTQVEIKLCLGNAQINLAFRSVCTNFVTLLE